MRIICMHCQDDLGQRGEEEGETAGLCDDCLGEHYPKEAEKVREMKAQEPTA